MLFTQIFSFKIVFTSLEAISRSNALRWNVYIVVGSVCTPRALPAGRVP